MKALFELCWQHEDEYRGHRFAISSQNFAEVVFLSRASLVEILIKLRSAYGPSDNEPAS